MIDSSFASFNSSIDIPVPLPVCNPCKTLWSCSIPRWDNLPSGHQRYPLLGLNLGYMYWGQKHSSEKIETYQYMQKKVVHVLMVFLGGFKGKK